MAERSLRNFLVKLYSSSASEIASILMWIDFRFVAAWHRTVQKLSRVAGTTLRHAICPPFAVRVVLARSVNA